MKHVAAAGAVLLLLAPLAACQPEHSPIMRPGENCLRCHDGTVARSWALAGTVFSSATATTDQGVEGVSVNVTAANGTQLPLVTNSAGNFYTAESLVEPFAIEVEHGGKTLSMAVPRIGACNSCHTDPPVNGAPGRIYTP